MEYSFTQYWGTLLLKKKKKVLVFIRNSNLTGSPAFLLAEFGAANQRCSEVVSCLTWRRQGEQLSWFLFWSTQRISHKENVLVPRGWNKPMLQVEKCGICPLARWADTGDIGKIFRRKWARALPLTAPTSAGIKTLRGESGIWLHPIFTTYE